MEKNFIRKTFRRENLLQGAIFNFFLGIASYFRLGLEAFIRSDMGRRYFKISSAATVVLILIWFPAGVYFIEQVVGSYTRYSNPYGSHQETSFWGRYGTWYLFTVLFIFFCRKRAKETYTHSNVYDFNRFSLSSGISLAFFYNLPFFNKKPSPYMVEVFIEPGFFFLIGFILKLMGQPLGTLLMISSICYGFSYAAAYKLQDDELQDIIDQIIAGEELERAFIQGLDPELTRGFRMNPGPEDENLRRKMASRIFPENDFDDTVYTAS